MAYFVPALCLVDPLPAPAIAPGPVGAQRTGRSVVVDPFLVRATDDPVHHRDRAHAKPVHVGQDLLGNTDVLAHIALLGEPSLQLDCLFVLGQNDADRQITRPAVIRPVEGDRSHREAPKAFLGLLGQPLACLLPEHAFPRSAVRPCPTVTQVGLAPKASASKLQTFVRCSWEGAHSLGDCSPTRTPSRAHFVGRPFYARGRVPHQSALTARSGFCITLKSRISAYSAGRYWTRLTRRGSCPWAAWP